MISLLLYVPPLIQSCVQKQNKKNQPKTQKPNLNKYMYISIISCLAALNKQKNNIKTPKPHVNGLLPPPVLIMYQICYS